MTLLRKMDVGHWAIGAVSAVLIQSSRWHTSFPDRRDRPWPVARPDASVDGKEGACAPGMCVYGSPGVTKSLSFNRLPA